MENFNGSGKNGRLVISKKYGVEGNCIFLPAAGYRDDADLHSTGYDGYYWSSSLNTVYPNNALVLSFDSDNAKYGNDDRFFGQSVRPVQAME